MCPAPLRTCMGSNDGFPSLALPRRIRCTLPLLGWDAERSLALPGLELGGTN